MGNIKIKNQGTPVTPASGYTEVYVDQADKVLKTKDDAGLVKNVDDAASIQGVTVDDANIADARQLAYDSGSGTLKYVEAVAATSDLANIGSPTYKTIQQAHDVYHSTGTFDECEITDDADGTITVSAGSGALRATNDTKAELLFIDWAAESGTNVNLVDNATNHIYIEYNAGSPRAIATTTPRDSDRQTNIHIGHVFREGTLLHINCNVRYDVGDHARKMIDRLQAIEPYAHESGAVASEVGTRNIAVTAGSFWESFTNFTTDAIDTSAADTFHDYYYRDGVGGWTSITGQTQIDNTQYDDGSGTLSTLTPSRYGAHWGYFSADGDLHLIYGRGDYTLSQAQDAQPPGDIPPALLAGFTLVFKCIIQNGSSTFLSLESAFDISFTSSVATDHGGLIGLADDDHVQYTLLSGRNGGQTLYGSVIASQDLVIKSTSDPTKGVVRVEEDGVVALGAPAEAGKIADGDMANNTISFYMEEAEQEIIVKTKTSGGVILEGALYNGHTGISDKHITKAIVIPANHLMILRNATLMAGSSIKIESGSEIYAL